MKNNRKKSVGPPKKHQTTPVTNAQILRALGERAAIVQTETANIHEEVSAGVVKSIPANPKVENGTIRQFRAVMVKPGITLGIRSVRTFAEVRITPRSLREHEKQILSSACDTIEEKLKGTSYEEPMKILMQVTGFYATSSRHVNAYSGEYMGNPVVIINSKEFSETNDELTVSVLHELLHLITEPCIGGPASLDEARHDLYCYALLGVPPPHRHWSFALFPHLQDEQIVIERNEEGQSA